MTLTSLEDPIREEESETRMSLLVDEKAKIRITRSMNFICEKP